MPRGCGATYAVECAIELLWDLAFDFYIRDLGISPEWARGSSEVVVEVVGLDHGVQCVSSGQRIRREAASHGD